MAEVTWVGHGTVLVDLDGVRVLTDPLLRDRVVHLRRHAPLPPPQMLKGLDAVLLTHLHRDHLDLPSLAAGRAAGAGRRAARRRPAAAAARVRLRA